MSKRVRILVLEGPISVGLGVTLQQDGWYARTAATPQQLINESDEADLLILDTRHSDLTLSFYRQLEQSVTLPVLMVAPEASDKFTVALLRSPSDRNELYEKINDLLANRQEHILYAGDLEIDSKAHRVSRAGKRINLSPTEFQLLLYLRRRAEEAVTFEQMLVDLWDYEPGTGDPKLVTSTVRHLRRKLVNDADQLDYIVSVRGVGYRLRKGLSLN